MEAIGKDLKINIDRKTRIKENKPEIDDKIQR